LTPAGAVGDKLTELFQSRRDVGSAKPWIKHRNVSVEFRDDVPLRPTRSAGVWRGLSAEYVDIQGPREFGYRWQGSSHYLALHDIRLVGGETRLEGAEPVQLLDLRDRMTFVPAGGEITGWSRLAERQNSYLAVYYDPSILLEEFDGRYSMRDARPLLYFDDAGLRSTLVKIKALLNDPSPDELYGETLGLLAAIEVDRLQTGVEVQVRESGKLSAGQERVVREYIEENLLRDISLDELAGLAQLSRFHFVRAFKKSTGWPPHQFILRQRVERAKRRLSTSAEPIHSIAGALGFGSAAQFSGTFGKITGCSPSQFRRQR
jgi:AraC family transcriptional regulator